MTNRLLTGMGLLLVDLGVFLATVAFLPRKGSFGFNGPWSHFINSRDRWDIAWCVLVAAITCSVGVFLLMDGIGIFRKLEKHIEPAA
jgi:hypothetical protein